MGEYTRRIQIAYITDVDPHDKHACSGMTYYMAQALQQHCGDVHFIAPARSLTRDVLGPVLDKGTRALLRRRIAPDRLLHVAHKTALYLEKQLQAGAFDLVFAPATSTEIAFLNTALPIVYAASATIEQLYDYAQPYTSLLSWSQKQCDEIEVAAFQNATALLFSSTWAALSAIASYLIEPAKVYTLPFGANLDTIPPKEIAHTRKKSYRCTLLFIGLEWAQKGGDIAFETLLALEELGIEAELIICGTTPPAAYRHARMKVIPFLDKNEKQQRYELERLYRTADFLLLPAREQTFGAAYCEASAYGIPCLAASTGGVAEVVRNGENGFVLPYEARGRAYAEVIAEIYSNDHLYTHLARASRHVFEEHLNWDVWGQQTRAIMLDILSQPIAVM